MEMIGGGLQGKRHSCQAASSASGSEGMLHSGMNVTRGAPSLNVQLTGAVFNKHFMTKNRLDRKTHISVPCGDNQYLSYKWRRKS